MQDQDTQVDGGGGLLRHTSPSQVHVDNKPTDNIGFGLVAVGRPVFRVLTFRDGTLPRWKFLLAVLGFLVSNAAGYFIAAELVAREQWAAFIPLATVWLIVTWLWVAAAMARTRDMREPSLAVAFLTLVPILGWVATIYLCVTKDELAE